MLQTETPKMRRMPLQIVQGMLVVSLGLLSRGGRATAGAVTVILVSESVHPMVRSLHCPEKKASRLAADFPVSVRQVDPAVLDPLKVITSKEDGCSSRSWV
jgi:hypothetical protein